jgi:hypothetical protein
MSKGIVSKVIINKVICIVIVSLTAPFATHSTDVYIAVDIW